MARGRLFGRWSPWLVIAVVAAVLVVAGGGAAGACKLWLDCHLGSSPGITALANEITTFSGTGAGAMGLPANVHATVVAKGFSYPTDFDFLPDGRIVVAAKDGLISIVPPDGSRPAKPFLDIRPEVNTKYFRGVMDVTVDPDFAAHPFVYVLYTARIGKRDTVDSTVMHLSRFRVAGGSADRASERVLVGAADARPCEQGPPSADCLPASLDVVGGEIVFVSDGSMFVSTGYGGGFEEVEAQAFLAEDLDALGGKVLRIDRDGRGLPDNPFATGDLDANRSKVWAYGFRNPFRIAMLPGEPMTLVAADVGWNSWDRLVRVERGGDYGWPCYEALDRTPEYRDTPECKAYYEEHPSAPASPWVSVSLGEPSSKQASAIVGGVVLAEATALPEELRRDYVYGNWSTNRIDLVPYATVDDPEPRGFAMNAAGPAAFHVGPDGALYYLALNVGELRRIAMS